MRDRKLMLWALYAFLYSIPISVQSVKRKFLDTHLLSFPSPSLFSQFFYPIFSFGREKGQKGNEKIKTAVKIPCQLYKPVGSGQNRSGRSGPKLPMSCDLLTPSRLRWTTNLLDGVQPGKSIMLECRL
jgi:hypothetical protein